MNLPIYIKNKVIYGKKIGRTIGAPTANIPYDDKNPIEFGVYGSFVYIDDKQYIGITNIGPRPTVDNDESPTIETHIIDFNDDIYGKVIEISLEYYIRGIQKFDSIDDLKNQVKKDIEEVKENLGG